MFKDHPTLSEMGRRQDDDTSTGRETDRQQVQDRGLVLGNALAGAPEVGGESRGHGYAERGSVYKTVRCLLPALSAPKHPAFYESPAALYQPVPSAAGQPAGAKLSTSYAWNQNPPKIKIIYGERGRMNGQSLVAGAGDAPRGPLWKDPCGDKAGEAALRGFTWLSMAPAQGPPDQEPEEEITMEDSPTMVKMDQGEKQVLRSPRRRYLPKALGYVTGDMKEFASWLKGYTPLSPWCCYKTADGGGGDQSLDGPPELSLCEQEAQSCRTELSGKKRGSGVNKRPLFVLLPQPHKC
ncbi:uncharacterized protein LOC115943826 [Leptonychotes weddellii]|uniref:Uncharacterized protein LOC115943826 n=1 Tax=Leptonychotes weddellii TaxID=9713 RepID=A0A7F8RIZ2_LEPWE|nr:uncharacterized protein LOC115943826 [Leptonychotes weddellii]